MTVRFENPPLVELVAELRWKDPSMPEIPAGFPADFPSPFLSEPFEKSIPVFNNAMASIGYGASERLFPVGFPVPSAAPIVRYRYSGSIADSGQDHLPSTLFQVGHQIFTANAVKPYKSWDDFKPIVEGGIKCLLKWHDGRIPSYKLLLRYIDLFDEQYTQGRSHLDFITQVFGLEVNLPPAIMGHTNNGQANIPAIQITLPHEFGTLKLNMAEGEIENTRGYLFESIFSIDVEATASAEDIMEKLSQARDVIHDIFINLTKPIENIMAPAEV